MEFAYESLDGRPSLLPLEPTRVAAACRAALDAIDGATNPEEALEAALGALHEHLDGAFVAALVVEHGRLWYVASRGFAMTADGIPVADGIVGRAMRSGRIQYVPDLAADPAYVEVVSGVSSEIAIPLHAGDEVIGVVNIESVAPLPRESARLLRPLAAAFGPVLGAVRNTRSLDLSGLARLFVHVSSLRDPREIAEIVTASLTRVLPIETSQLYLRRDDGSLELLACRCVSKDAPEALSVADVTALRAQSGDAALMSEVDLTASAIGGAEARSAVLLPLRANGDDLGILVGTTRWTPEIGRPQAEVATVLAAQAAASVDAALSLGRERHSALTDALTGLLNRRGFELELEAALVVAQEARRPLSLWVLDCDDFKEVNDRAGHEFGDALLREVGQVLAEVLPEGARAGRLGGDEFVVMLPGADSASAEKSAAEIGTRLAEGLKEAGFPLHLSGGVATYPFDGGGSSQLVRAADQALYEAKETGKNRVVAFRELVRDGSRSTSSGAAVTGARLGRSDTSMLVEAAEAATEIAGERTVEAVLERLCKTLTFVAGATGCAISRVVGDKLFDSVAHTLRNVHITMGNAYLIDDFPVTKELLESRQARAISFLDDDLDRAEAFVLREFRMNCALLLPLIVDDAAWGLVELYDVRLRRFTREQQAVSEFLVAIAARRIEALGSGASVRPLLPLYRPPSDT
jgi:diguanylate cyclase (GGDEF)-like protein